MGLEIFTTEIDGEQGLDVRIWSHKATVHDLLLALQAPANDPTVFKPYHKARYARCEGCTYNCCKPNDITVDLIAAEALAHVLGLSLRRFAEAYLKLSSDIPYPEFKRRPCPFLQDNRCTVYQERALICRLYLCTPMTDKLEKLRGAVLLAGEAALRRRLSELGLGPKAWQDKELRAALHERYNQGEISRADWDEYSEQLEILSNKNPFQNGKGYTDILLQECCTDTLWAFLVSE